MTRRDRVVTGRAVAGGACRALGVVVLIVALDWALGAVWESATDDPPATPAAATASTDTDAADVADATSTTGAAADSPVSLLPQDQLDERVDSPALAGAAWRAGYFSEFARLRYDYVPYLYSQAATNRGRYINTRAGVRRSYEPDVVGDVPEVWFFGGSAMWGEGQRDLHTIASAVARIAEADGLPVHVTNRGERAWVIWQEALLFERSLAHEAVPDLAVFYDGANELGVQGEQPYPEPTPADLAGWSESLTGRALEPGEPHAPPDPDVSMRQALSDLFDEYRSTSALGRVVGNVGSIFATRPAGAQSGGRDEGTTPDDPEARNAVDIYRRGRALAQLIGEDAEVPTMFFWQPSLNTSPAHRDSARRMAPDTIDLTAVLDDVTEPIYTDVIHTNELGARLVAEAMWEHLRPEVAAWYEAQSR